MLIIDINYVIMSKVIVVMVIAELVALEVLKIVSVISSISSFSRGINCTKKFSFSK